jgi:hypothetical protein
MLATKTPREIRHGLEEDAGNFGVVSKEEELFGG